MFNYQLYLAENDLYIKKKFYEIFCHTLNESVQKASNKYVLI